MQTIGERISCSRKKLKLSQEQLAEKMDVSRQTVYRWEANLVIPNTDRLKALCEILDVDADYILIGKPVNVAIEEGSTAVTATEAVNEHEPPEAHVKTKLALKLMATIALSVLAVFAVFVLVSVGIIYFQPHTGIDEVTATEYHNFEGAAVLIAGSILVIEGIVSLIFWLCYRKKRKCTDNVT